MRLNRPSFDRLQNNEHDIKGLREGGWNSPPRGDSRDLPPSAFPVMRVDVEETEDASESLPPPLIADIIPLAVEFDLFFFGTGGSILPESSSRNRRCSLVKSPYLRATKCSSSPFLLIRSKNSACLWWRMCCLTEVIRTPATLTSQPLI